MSRFEVFVGAPTIQDLKQTNKSPHRWLTVSSIPKPATFFALPPATLEAASLRISRLYENIIFDGLGSEEEKECEEPSRDVERRPDTQEQSTLISWPPTGRDVEESRIEGGRDISFLRPTASLSGLRSQFQTQDTQETGSYDYSDASSIGHFPVFHFTLHNLTSLSTLQNKNGRNPVQRFQPNTSSPKLTVLAAVLEIEGPDTIRIKKGTDAGKDVSISKLIIGDDEGVVGKLTAWRDVAERWGGCYPDRDSPSIKRGDVVLFQNIVASKDNDSGTSGTNSALSLTASPNLLSKMEICFRTMPSGQTLDDSRFRPDLRLGFSDAAVRKVAAVVAWFESMAGLPRSETSPF